LTVVDVGADGLFAWCVERFIREAEFLRRLDHPNIVRVLDLFKDNATGGGRPRAT
jgi:serine/threonine protein kinase